MPNREQRLLKNMQSRKWGRSVTDSGLMRVLAISSSMVSLVSMGQRLFDVGLLGLFGEIIEYYRIFSATIFGFFPKIVFNISIPQIVCDVWVLSFMGAGALLRSRQTEEVQGHNSEGALVAIVYYVTVGASMGGAFYFFLSVLFIPITLLARGLEFVIQLSDGDVVEPDSDVKIFSLFAFTTDDVYDRSASWIVFSILAACLFFALNAFSGPA